MNLDAHVAPLAAPDALNDGSRGRLGLSEETVVPPRRSETQRDQPVGAAMGADYHGARQIVSARRYSGRSATEPSGPERHVCG